MYADLCHGLDYIHKHSKALENNRYDSLAAYQMMHIVIVAILQFQYLGGYEFEVSLQQSFLKV